MTRLHRRIRREAFHPTPLGLIVNPYYIVRSRLADSIAALAPRLEGELLDFGCGSKPYRDLFKHSQRYIGLDVQVSGHDHHDSVVDVFYDGRRLPFRTNSFDGALAFEVFEHVDDLDATLLALKDVLRPGGRLLFTMPFAWFEHEVPYDFRRLTSYGVREVCTRHGFQVQELRKSGNFVLAVGQLAVAYIYEYVIPRRNALLHRVLQLLLVPPLVGLTLFCNWVLPTRDQLYCNVVVLCVNEQ